MLANVSPEFHIPKRRRSRPENLARSRADTRHRSAGGAAGLLGAWALATGFSCRCFSAVLARVWRLEAIPKRSEIAQLRRIQRVLNVRVRLDTQNGCLLDRVCCTAQAWCWGELGQWVDRKRGHRATIHQLCSESMLTSGCESMGEPWRCTSRVSRHVKSSLSTDFPFT